MENFKDESFIQQFLSPKVIRDLKLFSILDDENRNEYEVLAIHDDAGYKQIRQQLAEQYNLSIREPNIQVFEVDLRGDRSITLHHTRHNNVPMNKQTLEVLKHFHRLWGFDVHLKSFDGEQLKKEYHVPQPAHDPDKQEQEQLKYV